MKAIYVTLWVEFLKLRKSRMLWATVVFMMLVASMMALVMFVQKYPEISGKLGLIGDKAQLMRFGEPVWQSYFRLSIEGLAGVGLVALGFITSWIFGREFSDHTLKDIIALPVSREYIVLSKFILVILWFILLAAVYLLTILAAGYVINLPGFSLGILSKYLYIYAVTCFLMLFLCTPVAFFATWAGGYILPLAFVILTLILANFSGLVGLGPYFPWAIPGLFGNPAGSEGMLLKNLSYIILVLTSFAGLAGTLALWKYSDQK